MFLKNRIKFMNTISNVDFVIKTTPNDYDFHLEILKHLGFNWCSSYRGEIPTRYSYNFPFILYQSNSKTLTRSANNRHNREVKDIFELLSNSNTLESFQSNGFIIYKTPLYISSYQIHDRTWTYFNTDSELSKQ